MTGESHIHRQLVRNLAFVVEEEHGQSRDLALFVDLSDEKGKESPPKIGNFIPDLFGQFVPGTKKIIGEAKTAGDISTERSIRQITEFLRYLGHFDMSVFYFAVPIFSGAAAQNVLNSVIRDGSKVTCKVIEDREAQRC